MKWFLIACIATASNPCEEWINIGISQEQGQQFAVEVLCDEILQDLIERGLKPKEYRCEFNTKEDKQ